MRLMQRLHCGYGTIRELGKTPPYVTKIDCKNVRLFFELFPLYIHDKPNQGLNIRLLIVVYSHMAAIASYRVFVIK